MPNSFFNKQSLRFILISLFLLTQIAISDDMLAKNNTPLTTKWKTLPATFYTSDIDRSFYYFRPVLIGEKELDYRICDNKGGFYICIQLAIADKNEHDREVEFDQIKQKYNYLMHYTPIGARVDPATWSIQQYRIEYLEIPSLDTLDSINFEAISMSSDWIHELNVQHGRMPNSYLSWNKLSEYADTQIQQEDIPSYIKKMDARFQSIDYEQDIKLINELIENNEYDRIVKTDNSTLYINTDRICYEISDDPDIFYVERREYHANGMLKNDRLFLAGVYTNESLPLHFDVAFDEDGNFANNYPEILINSWMPFGGLSIDYLLRFLEKKGYINMETGKGKPTMKINAHIDPHALSHGEPRLRISSDWQIQTDSGFASWVSLLVKNDDDTETVFIFSKDSKIIWDKFNR